MTVRRAVLGVTALALTACISSPGIFRIEPLRPVAELRREALLAVPPAPSGSERTSDLVEVVTLDPSIRLDIRYATARNFLGEPVYTQARAFLQRPAPRRWCALIGSSRRRVTGC
jgi:D-alanyl-D-alanine dipeptidase